MDGKVYKTDFNFVQTTIINNENMLFDSDKNKGILPSPVNGGFPPKKFKLDSACKFFNMDLIYLITKFHF